MQVDMKLYTSMVAWVIRSPSGFTSSSKSCNFWVDHRAEDATDLALLREGHVDER